MSESAPPILLDAGPSEAGWHRTESINVCPRRAGLEEYLDARHRVEPVAVNAHEKEPVAETDESLKTMKPAFARGGIIHVGLAHHYAQSLQDADRYYKPHDAISAYAAKMKLYYPGNPWDDLEALSHGIIDTYAQQWKNDFHRFEVLGIEKEMRMQVELPEDGSKFLFTQRVDLILRDKQKDEVLFVDHKTTSRYDPRANRGYSQSGQFAGYDIFGHLKYGVKYGGAMLNMIMVEAPYNHSRPPFVRGSGPQSSIVETIRMGERRRREMIKLYGPATKVLWPGVFTAYEPCRGPWGFCAFFNFCQHSTNLTEALEHGE